MLKKLKALFTVKEEIDNLRDDQIDNMLELQKCKEDIYQLGQCNTFNAVALSKFALKLGYMYDSSNNEWYKMDRK